MQIEPRPFLDFYNEHAIIPTNLNLPDQENFFAHRNYLLRTLGVPPLLLKKSKILEVGPGSGEKMVHLLSLNPSIYSAVDGNLKSCERIKQIASKTNFKGIINVNFIDFFDYSDSELYDLALSEGTVPFQIDPLKFLSKLLKFLNPGGILLFTCADEISVLAELLRRAIVRKLGLLTTNLESSAINISNFFSLDLDHLVGMTRVRTDWAIDQMIHPWIGEPLSIASALTELSNKVRFLGSSPKFSSDWRWYKSPGCIDDETNKQIISDFISKSHNLVDMRIVSAPINNNQNLDLSIFSKNIYDLVRTDEWNKKSDTILMSSCEKILDLLPEDAPETKISLQSFIKFLVSYNPNDLAEFRPWWGRGQQYVSLIKV